MVGWRQFPLFELGAEEVETFLTSPAVNGPVAASMQNQAKSALLFLYKEVLRLRAKDVEFSRREILVRDGKGNKDRVTLLPRPAPPTRLRARRRSFRADTFRTSARPSGSGGRAARPVRRT